jgi:4-carboxymuconolactone decarboxylase
MANGAVSSRGLPSRSTGSTVTKGRKMTNEKAPAGARAAFGEFAPALADYTDNVLFGEVWERPQLAKRDRSLVTVAALLAGGNPQQLTFHLQFAKDNGLSEEELKEAIIHLAFYAGWPKAMTAMAVAKEVFAAG